MADKEYAKRLKAFRKYKGLTQKEMAELTNREQPTIQRYESGALDIPLSFERMLHEKLNMNFYYLHGKSKTMEYVEPKGNLVKDINKIQSFYHLLESKMEDMEANMRKIYRDFYASEADKDRTKTPKKYLK